MPITVAVAGHQGLGALRQLVVDGLELPGARVACVGSAGRPAQVSSADHQIVGAIAVRVGLGEAAAGAELVVATGYLDAVRQPVLAAEHHDELPATAAEREVRVTVAVEVAGGGRFGEGGVLGRFAREVGAGLVDLVGGVLGRPVLGAGKDADRTGRLLRAFRAPVVDGRSGRVNDQLGLSVAVDVPSRCHVLLRRLCCGCSEAEGHRRRRDRRAYREFFAWDPFVVLVSHGMWAGRRSAKGRLPVRECSYECRCTVGSCPCRHVRTAARRVS